MHAWGGQLMCLDSLHSIITINHNPHLRPLHSNYRYSLTPKAKAAKLPYPIHTVGARILRIFTRIFTQACACEGERLLLLPPETTSLSPVRPWLPHRNFASLVFGLISAASFTTSDHTERSESEGEFLYYRNQN